MISLVFLLSLFASPEEVQIRQTAALEYEEAVYLGGDEDDLGEIMARMHAKLSNRNR